MTASKGSAFVLNSSYKYFTFRKTNTFFLKKYENFFSGQLHENYRKIIKNCFLFHTTEINFWSTYKKHFFETTIRNCST